MQFKIKSREISLVNNMNFVLKIYTEHSNAAAVLCEFFRPLI